MSLRKHTRVGAALFCALALTAAACGDNGGDGGSGDGSNKGLAKGGVLKLAGLRDLTHYDTNQAYEVRAWGFHLRATTRQMLSYENTTDEKKRDTPRSEEHTSELQSRQYLVCRLLVEKKNTFGGRPPATPSPPSVLPAKRTIRPHSPRSTLPSGAFCLAQSGSSPTFRSPKVSTRSRPL